MRGILDWVRVGVTVPSKYRPESLPLVVPVRGYVCVYCLAQPRYGKGVLMKDYAVQVSKTRRCCFMDYRGEWSRHVTHPNYGSEYPDCVGNYKIYRDFTFKLSEFLNVEDWVSMGFHRATEIRNLFVDTMSSHKGNPVEFMYILADLPTESKGSPMTLDEFNGKYGTEMLVGAHAETKRAWIRTMDKVRSWFWSGVDDERKIYDFGAEWLGHEHIFIDFSTDFVDAGISARNRTFFGKIMEKLEPFYKDIQGVIFVEEADVLLPSWHDAEGIKPSSNSQVIRYVAKAPKYQMGIVLIMQHMKQSDMDIKTCGQWQYFLGMYEEYPFPFKVKPGMQLKYRPESNYREFVFIDVNRQWTKFVPGTSCCEYESNIKGGG